MKLPEIYEISSGYISTPMNSELLVELISYDQYVSEHGITSWKEFTVTNYPIYPTTLVRMADLGIAFTWEYMLTEDFSYYAYNFPTEDKPSNLVLFKTGSKRKSFPRLPKKVYEEISKQSAANELLYKLGISNGTN